MSVLRLTGVTRHFGRTPVLRGIDLDVAADETVLLRGANGGGKTTLLRIAATTLRPTAGTVEVLGRTGTDARTFLAFVPQDAPVYRELTPIDHLRFQGRLRGADPGDGGARVLLRDAGLLPSADRPAGTLSRGQRQRLALAGALAADVPLLLLDEPFTALDAEGAAWLVDRLRDRSGAVLAAVHGDALLAADRTLTLHGGRLA